MKVYYSIETVPAFRRAVVTIGTFDGVHQGHRRIIGQLMEESARIAGETVIITFHPHPRKVVHSSRPPIYLINTIEEKIELLEHCGIDHLVIIPFTEAFSKMSASAYVEDFLISRFHPHTVIIGYDHRFGEGRKGNYELLEAYAARGAFNLKEIPQQVVDSSIVSSTRIREAVLMGDMEVANQLLGYDFFFEGKVIKGDQLGRTLGYPTANLEIENPEKLVPGNGVYAVQLAIVDRQAAPADTANKPYPETKKELLYTSGLRPSLKGMMNIGFRPTAGGRKRTIEVNLFDFNEDIYGSTLRVFVKKFLRAEEKFNGLDALKIQLAKDKIAALEVLPGS